jgi:hypothetical protein
MCLFAALPPSGMQLMQQADTSETATHRNKRNIRPTKLYVTSYVQD